MLLNISNQTIRCGVLLHCVSIYNVYYAVSQMHLNSKVGILINCMWPRQVQRWRPTATQYCRFKQCAQHFFIILSDCYHQCSSWPHPEINWFDPCCKYLNIYLWNKCILNKQKHSYLSKHLYDDNYHPRLHSSVKAKSSASGWGLVEWSLSLSLWTTVSVGITCLMTFLKFHDPSIVFNNYHIQSYPATLGSLKITFIYY